MKLIKILATTLCFSAFSTGAAMADAVNSVCPVSGVEVEVGTEVNVPVAFCCGKCKGKFDAEPGAFIEKVAEAEEGKCPVSGKSVDEDETSVLVIGTCCKKCRGKVEEDPKKYLGKVKAK